jgi:glycosyltransferase involved in cell wall biosynthesis
VDSAFKNGIHGVKVEPHDVEALGRSIKSLLEDKTKRDAYGRKGRDHVKANYSISSAVQREVALIKMLVNKDA